MDTYEFSYHPSELFSSDADIAGWSDDIDDDGSRDLIGPRAPTGTLPLPNPAPAISALMERGYFVFDGDLDLTDERLHHASPHAISGSNDIHAFVEVADSSRGGPLCLNDLTSTPADAAPAGHWFMDEPSTGPGYWKGSLLLRSSGPDTSVVGYATITIDIRRSEELPYDIEERIGLADPEVSDEAHDAVLASYVSRNLSASASFDFLFVDAGYRGLGAGRILGQIVSITYLEVFVQLRRWIASGDRDMWMDLTLESQILDERAAACVLPAFNRIGEVLVEEGFDPCGWRKRLTVHLSEESEIAF